MIYVDEERCTGCGTCVEVCPAGAIRLVDGVASIAQEKCIECEACLSACPETAILSVTEDVPAKKEPITPVKTASRVSLDVPRAARVVPWVGAALAFVGKEVLPRLATHFVDSLARSDDRSTVRDEGGVSDGTEGRRRRLRRRQGKS
ncbi:MAG: DUF362 domain-containing protein [Anaerolineales bacterium]